MIYTIGHSSHSLDSFLALLEGVGCEWVVDVRSVPYSRRFRQFNRELLADSLRGHGMGYVFMGKELGGRLLERMSLEEYFGRAEFREAMGRIMEAERKGRVVLMCAERDPMWCHRALVLGWWLHERGVEVGHILASGEVMTHQEFERKLLERYGEKDLSRAYLKQLDLVYG